MPTVTAVKIAKLPAKELCKKPFTGSSIINLYHGSIPESKITQTRTV